MLTALIIPVPPMAAMFFQGTLGGFSPYSVFSGGAQRPGPQGQPPGSWGGGSLPDVSGTRHQNAANIGNGAWPRS